MSVYNEDPPIPKKVTYENTSTASRTKKKHRKSMVRLRDDPIDKYLQESLSMLQEIEVDLDEDDEQPSSRLIENVGKLLRRLYEEAYVPGSIDVHGMPEGDITLNISTIRGRNMVFIHCDADDSAYCMVKAKNVRRTQSYDSIEVLPDAFVCTAMRQLSDPDA